MKLRQQLAADDFANRLTLQKNDFLGRRGLQALDHKHALALQDAQYRAQLGLQNDQQAFTTTRDSTLFGYGEQSALNQHTRQLELLRLGHVNEMEAIGERGRQSLLGIRAQGDVQYGLMGFGHTLTQEDRERHAQAIDEYNRKLQGYFDGTVSYEELSAAQGRLGALGGPGQFVLDEPERIGSGVGRRAIQGYPVGRDATRRFGLPLPEGFYDRPRTYGPLPGPNVPSDNWFDFLGRNFSSPLGPRY
jgi:hypothetical protein